MAPCLRQTSIIFRQVEIPLAHRRSKWTNSEAGNTMRVNVSLLTKSWQPYSCLNSQNYHPPHGTPSFMAFPTYKLGCDRRHIPMVSMTNSTSCQLTLSSTSPWHNADRIDFFQVIFLCFWFLPHSFQPFHKSLRSPPKNRALPRSSSTSNNSSSSSRL